MQFRWNTGAALLALLAAALAVPAWTAGAAEGTGIHPLAPPDRSSPRATLRSFIANADQAYRLYLTDKDADEAAYAFRRAVECLDLSAVAPTLHFDVGGYSVLVLKEVLDRIDLPPYQDIPGADSELDRWRLPDTEIVIRRVEEGDREGEFLFSADTVERVEQFYERIKDLPYRPGASEGLLGFYLDNPGGMVPLHWGEALPAWAGIRVFERPVWKWLALIGFMLLGAVAVVGVRRVGRRWDRRVGERAGYLRLGALMFGLSLVALAWALDVFVDDVIGLRGDVEAFIKRGALIFAFTAAVFCVFAGFEILGAVLVASSRSPVNGADAHLIRILVRIVAIGVLVYVLIEASAYLGWAVAPLVAGLGVGGLAVALAARPTFENVIGGLILFADKPFRVGDLCRFGEDIGHVETIGLRSTRIRTLERSLVSVPNADMAMMKIDNLGLRDMRLLQRNLGLRYETTPDQLRWVLAKTREMLLSHPMVSPDRLRVRFSGYGAYSLDLEIYAYLKCQTQDSYLAIAEDLMLRVMDIVNEAGTAFAFPSQVNYLGRDEGVDVVQREQREAEVKQWRQRDKLPFPDFDEEDVDQLGDTLDYPPRGSPHYKPRSRQ